MNVPNICLDIIVLFVLIQKEALSQEDTENFRANISRFYGHHRRFKWTLWGNEGDAGITCKVDIVRANNGTHVTFVRKYISGSFIKETLTGKFVQGAPYMMQVYKHDQYLDTEQLVKLIQLGDHMACGVFYTIFPKENTRPSASRLPLCEVRMKTTRNFPPKSFYYTRCLELYEKYCSKGPKYDVYDDSCKAKMFLQADE